MSAIQVLSALFLGSFGMIQAAHEQTNAADTAPGMEKAIALLTEARDCFQNVRDYECRLIKQERIKGTLLPQSVMFVKVRNKPFSVFLRCESPAADRGMEVCYVEGRDQGMMRVHPPRILGVLGFWSVDPHDARAFEKNRHCIIDAGLGTLLENTARYWERERRLNKTLVRITNDEVAGRACTRIETIHPECDRVHFYGCRCVLWLDNETHLPAGAETYDWPVRNSLEESVLLESYRYLGLRCNIGLGASDFPR
jgi:Protein of unknown function (DUF1571)